MGLCRAALASLFILPLASSFCPGAALTALSSEAPWRRGVGRLGGRGSVDPRAAGVTMEGGKTAIISGLRELADRYDGFILDQYGVMHNGETALPGAVECFNRLAKAGKKMVVLSNTSRRSGNASSKLPSMGFALEHTLGLVSSGEEAWKHVQAERRGTKCVWLTWDREGGSEGSYIDGCDLTLASVDEADFILCHGSELIKGASTSRTGYMSSGSLQAYDELLKRAAERKLPMVCANPDLRTTLPSGEVGYMPGGIAAAYESMGGGVVWFGKPHAQHFRACLSILGGEAGGGGGMRVLHVGDSLQHDIAGAKNAGVDSLFIAGGIHAEQLGLRGAGDKELRDGSALKEGALLKLQDGEGVHATWACKAFVW